MDAVAIFVLIIIINIFIFQTLKLPTRVQLLLIYFLTTLGLCTLSSWTEITFQVKFELDKTRPQNKTVGQVGPQTHYETQQLAIGKLPYLTTPCNTSTYTQWDSRQISNTNTTYTIIGLSFQCLQFLLFFFGLLIHTQTNWLSFLPKSITILLIWVFQCFCSLLFLGPIIGTIPCEYFTKTTITITKVNLVYPTVGLNVLNIFLGLALLFPTPQFFRCPNDIKSGDDSASSPD